MAKHGKQRHLKRLAAPKIIPIHRKEAMYLKKTSAGRHNKEESMALLVLLRDLLKVASDRREAKAIISSSLLVDGKKPTNEGFPIGLMDVISIPKSSKHYRMVVSGGKLVPKEVAQSESKAKLCRITGKKLVKGNKIQLQFHDGRSYLIEKEEDRFKLGDTIKLSIPKQKLESFLKMQKGARCYIFKGKHAGELAELVELQERTGSTATDAKLKSASGEFNTRKDYVFVVDDAFDA